MHNANATINIYLGIGICFLNKYKRNIGTENMLATVLKRSPDGIDDTIFAKEPIRREYNSKVSIPYFTLFFLGTNEIIIIASPQDIIIFEAFRYQFAWAQDC